MGKDLRAWRCGRVALVEDAIGIGNQPVRDRSGLDASLAWFQESLWFATGPFRRASRALCYFAPELRPGGKSWQGDAGFRSQVGRGPLSAECVTQGARLETLAR